MKEISVIRGAWMSLALLTVCQWSAKIPAVEPDVSAIGTGAEWHNVNGDSDETGFSRLDQIKAANVSRLGLAWHLDLPGRRAWKHHRLKSAVFLLHRFLRHAVRGGCFQRQVIVEVETQDLGTQSAQDGVQLWRQPWRRLCQRESLFAALDGRLMALDATRRSKMERRDDRSQKWPDDNRRSACVRWQGDHRTGWSRLRYARLRHGL